MGIRERKIKHKEDLKQSILAAAKKLFLSEGYGATSIRKIAAEIEFSPTTIYLYYKDKAEIAHALHQEGFKELGSRFAVLAHIEHPFERLKAMGRVYIQFALEHREYYELMFIMSEPLDYLAEGNEDCWQEGQQAFHFLLGTITECQKVGYFTAFDAESFSLMVWSTMHGLCTLQLHGHLAKVVEKKQILAGVENVLSHTYESYVKVLESLKE
ncbi:MAG: TetR/AcrR family transcriptional regulator [Chitinophagaceae bacterium]